MVLASQLFIPATTSFLNRVPPCAQSKGRTTTVGHLAIHGDPVFRAFRSEKRVGASTGSLEMSLDSLSNELIVQIINYLVSTWEAKLYTGRNLADVKSLARCSRSLHALAEPVINRELIEREQDEDDPLRWLQMIVRKPRIASYVKHLVVSCPPRYETADFSPPFTEDDYRKTRALIASTGSFPEETEILVDQIRNETPGAVLALLLACLPNLEAVNFLSYGYDASYDEKDDESGTEDDSSNEGATKVNFIEHVFAAARLAQQPGHKGPTPLQRLSSISVADKHLPDSPRLSLSSMAALLLPSVTRVFFKDIQAVRPSEDCDVGDGSGVQQVCISGVIPGIALARFLQRTPHVQSVEYIQRVSDVDVWDRDGDLEESFVCNFLPQHITPAMSHLKSSLESLTVYDYTGRRRDEHEATTLGTLADFERLKSISTNFQNLVLDETAPLTQELIDMLPPCIEFLELLIDTKNLGFVEHLRNLAVLRRTRFALLGRIVVRIRRNLLHIPDEIECELEEDMHQAGIFLTYGNYDLR